MFLNQLKTVILLSGLSALLFLIGFCAGGTNGLMIALIISLFMNFISYFWSDKIVLAMYGAQELDRTKHAKIHEMVQKLSRNANIPMPKLWYIDTPMANAFATGRNPEHGSVAVTQGILDILDDRELNGVLAHELSHIKNRDILIATVAATIATAISYIANMLQWAAFFGGLGGKDEDNRRGSGGIIGTLLVAIIMPIAAMLIQMAISRSREYLADESGAKISYDPLALASALQKLGMGAKIHHVEPESPAQTATASLFIVYPFSGSGWINLFSTHPPMEERIKRLKKIAQEK
jgi:heat shock protein HtpX